MAVEIEEQQTQVVVEDKFPELNAYLDDMKRAGMRVTNEWKEMWVTALRYAWGQQLEGIDVSGNETWSYIVVNRIYPLMFQTIAKLAKNHPKVLTFPWAEDNQASEYVEMWAGILQYIWESPYELNMRLKLIIGLLDAALFGYMVGKVIWEPKCTYDEDRMFWIGNVQHEFIHPATFWTDPAAESIENKRVCKSCGTSRIVTMDWAIKRWPEYEDEIKAQAFTDEDPQYTDASVIVYEHQKGSTLEVNPKMKFTKIINLLLKNYERSISRTLSDDVTKKQNYVLVDEHYFEDNEEEEFKIEDNVPIQRLIQSGLAVNNNVNGMFFLKDGTELDNTNWPKETIKEGRRPVYPKGRFVIRIGKTILNPEKEQQQYKRSRWPFSVMPYHILPHMWQGCNAVEMARNNNDILNLTISALVHRVRLTADPERVIEDGALAKDRKGNPLIKRLSETKGLGRIIVAAQGKIDKFKNIDYSPLDPSTMLLAQILKQDIDDSMFMQPVARGAATGKNVLGSGSGGKATATEVARADTNAHDYTALQAIFLDGFIDSTLTNIAEVVQQHYDEGRLLRLIDDDRQRQLIKMSQPLLDVKFDVNIEPGSTLPFDEAQKKNDYLAAYKLLENPVPNPMLEDMLRILKISNRKKILQKYQGILLYKQFIGLSQQFAQADPATVKAVLTKLPALQPLYQLMQQAAQLQPQQQIRRGA